MKLIISIDNNLAEALAELAKDSGTTRSSLIRRMLWTQYVYEKQHWEKTKAAIEKKPKEDLSRAIEIAGVTWLK